MIKENGNEIEKNVSKFCILQFKNAYLNKNIDFIILLIYLLYVYIYIKSYKIDWKLDIR